MIKKRMLFCVLCLMSGVLVSCEVHWGGKSADVPWWMIAIPVAVFLIIVLYLVGKSLSSKLHICPRCQKSFYPKWWQVAFTVYKNGEGVLRCPHCKIKGFCRISHKEDWDEW